MHTFGALELDITPGTPDNPASIKFALLRYPRGEDGRLFISPESASLEELDGQFNPSKAKTLQDELGRDPRASPPGLPGYLENGPATLNQP